MSDDGSLYDSEDESSHRLEDHHNPHNFNYIHQPYSDNSTNQQSDTSDEEFDDDDESPVCRICRGEATPSEPLFHPCKCSGSIKYVHQNCLQEWLEKSNKPNICDLCHSKFKYEKGKYIF